MPKNISENLSQEELNLVSRILNLILGRALKTAYLNLSGEIQKKMQEVFSIGIEGDIEKFIKKHIPNFNKILKEEAQKIQDEIKSEVETRL